MNTNPLQSTLGYVLYTAVRGVIPFTGITNGICDNAKVKRNQANVGIGGRVVMAVKYVVLGLMG